MQTTENKSIVNVSFDFDCTLDKPIIQQYAKQLVDKGIEVWICTSRLSNSEAPNSAWNDDLYKVAKEVGIKEQNIKFCAYSDKYLFFKDKDFIWHLDDDTYEINLINKKTKTKGISSFGNSSWLKKCEKLLNKYLE